MIARTQAVGSTLLPELLAFTSSLEVDRALLEEDLVGSLAHLAMLEATGILGKEAAGKIRGGLVAIWKERPSLPAEEDVHMAVEALLSGRIGEPAGLLHTARSRNDQVALDSRLHVREQCARILEDLAGLIEALSTRAAAETGTLLPSYTHRQRAQPVSAAFWLASHGAAFARDLQAFQFALGEADLCPLGSGAIAGTSLPIDRRLVARLLGFSGITANAMDTVGDRDFALDFAYAAARLLLHLGRLSTDLVDFSTAEFGLVKLEGSIAFGSSMMPQKRNPDVFELSRGKAGRAVGNLVGLLVTLKGLPAGYNRDLQEDRAAILETGPLVRGTLAAISAALPHLHFDRARGEAALAGDATQATDMAEALVKKGATFRRAYQAVGALVRRCQDQGIPLAAATAQLAQEADPLLDAEVLRANDPLRSPARKEVPGGTGPASVSKQLEDLRAAAAAARARAAQVPRLQALFSALERGTSP